VKRLVQSALSCLAAIATGSCVTTPVARTGLDPERETAVLFVGNSYSFGVPKAFAALAAERGKRVRVEQVTHGGWTLARHTACPDTLAKIRARRWDVVVIQEQSKLPSQPTRREAGMFPHVRKLAEEARGQGALPVLYQTWGYRNGNPELPGDDFQAMTSRLREGYRAAARQAGGLPVVAVGDAWEREVSAGRGADLYQADGNHPSRAGDQLTATAFYEALFGDGGILQPAPNHRRMRFKTGKSTADGG
jgi:hypothetical protein